MNIVTVDNNPDELSKLASTIKEISPHCQIHSFTDPLSSAKYICNNPVDMVFLADDMRPANGFKLMWVLRKNIPELPIVMLSEKSTNRAIALKANASGFLMKPVSADLLGGVLKQLVV